jgi:two-component system, OmpR family, sensor histidine kinase CreC
MDSHSPGHRLLLKGTLVKIRVRIFLAILIIAGIGFSLLVHWITRDLRPQLRGATEEPLADTAWVLASIASTQTHNGTIDAALFRRGFENMSRQITPAPIYDFIKTTMDLRIYMTDMAGKVIFDSTGRDVGADYSRWNDVALTLQGKYGTRTSSEIEVEPEVSVMYVAAPIRTDEKIMGVISVGKPTRNVNAFVKQSREKVILGGLLTFSVVVIATLVVSAMIIRPIERLITYVKSVSQGRREPFPKLDGGEVGQLGKAFEEMRSALEGKQYVENYVQTLTHEMKSPLAAIQGAVELLKEKMPIERRERFLINIESEVKRMQHVIERLLLLSSIENRKTLQEIEAIDLFTIVKKAVQASDSICMARDIDFLVTGDAPAVVYGETFLIELAVANIIQNALDFSPRGSTLTAGIVCTGNTVRLSVEDQGPGIPDYAIPRVFERFYSLNRPDTGKKSSGLGLSVVREAMILHGGSASLENLPDGGAVATLIFPSR